MATGNKSRYPIQVVWPFGVTADRPGAGNQAVFPFGAAGIGIVSNLTLGGLSYFYAFEQAGTAGMRESVSSFDPDLNLYGQIGVGAGDGDAHSTPVGWNDGISAPQTYPVPMPGGIVINGEAIGGVALAVSAVVWAQNAFAWIGEGVEKEVNSRFQLGTVGGSPYIGFRLTGTTVANSPIYARLLLNGSDIMGVSLERGHLYQITAIRYGQYGWLCVNGVLVFSHTFASGIPDEITGVAVPCLGLSNDQADGYDNLCGFTGLESYGIDGEADNAEALAAALWNGARYKMFRPNAVEADTSGFVAALETVELSGVHAKLDFIYTFDPISMEQEWLCAVWVLYFNGDRSRILTKVNGIWGVYVYGLDDWLSIVLASCAAPLDPDGDELPWPDDAWELNDEVFEVVDAGTTGANGWYWKQGELGVKPDYRGGELVGGLGYTIDWNVGAARWELKTENDLTVLYYADDDTAVPPATGWHLGDGAEPVPELEWLVDPFIPT